MKSLNFRLNRPSCSRSGIIARRHRVTKQGAISNPHKWISNIFVAPFSAIAFPLSLFIFAYNNISLRALASLLFQLLKTGWLIGWTFLYIIWKQFKFIWFHLRLSFEIQTENRRLLLLRNRWLLKNNNLLLLFLKHIHILRITNQVALALLV